MTFSSELRIRKARKVHKCTWCGQKIEVGEQYKYWANVDEGWFNNKMHFECEENMREEMGSDWNFEYYPYDNERPPNRITVSPTGEP